jgi:tRNA (mo5U34)-methyltransferase
MRPGLIQVDKTVPVDAMIRYSVSMDQAELQRAVDAIRWVHRIDLGQGVITPGAWNTPEMLPRLHLPANLSGQTVLDVGCWDGFYSFATEKLGAQRVLATDSFVWQSGHKEGFLLARQTLHSKVEDIDIDVLDLAPERIGKFDIVLFLGVLYHMKHPMLALERVATVTKRMLVLETVIDLLHVPGKALAFYPGSELDSDDTNWFAPTPAAAVAMLWSVGFRRIERVWPTPGRLMLWRVLSALGFRTIRRAVYHAFWE